MKPHSHLQSFPTLVVTVLLTLATTAPISWAGALGKAAGTYNGNLTGVAQLPVIGSQRLSNTNAKLKLPRGKGRIVITIDGYQRTSGKVTKVRVRQGGKKVVQTGTTRIPASVTAALPVALGSVTGPFKAVVKLSGPTPTVRATTTLMKIGITVKGTYKGTHS